MSKVYRLFRKQLISLSAALHGNLNDCFDHNRKRLFRNFSRFISVQPCHQTNDTHTRFELTFQAQSDDLWKSNQYQFQVSGTTRNLKLFESEFRSVDKANIFYVSSCIRTTIESGLTSSGLLALETTLKVKRIGLTSRRVKICDVNAIKQCVLNNLWRIYCDETFADFTFVVEGKEFKVHKAILAAASPVMSRIFTTDMRESRESVCKLDEIEPKIFECLLRFIYFGEVPDDIKDISIELYKAAHYYCIEKLKEICKQETHFNLSVENAMETCILACIYDLDELKVDAWNIVK